VRGDDLAVPALVDGRALVGEHGSQPGVLPVTRVALDSGAGPAR
jgi:hypothetical protein